MNYSIKSFLLIIFSLFLLFSCGESHVEEENEEPSVYEMMETAFEDSPKESEIKPLMEDVMKTYNIEINDKNLEKVASMLIDLRKKSKVGVTEMDILKDIYQNGLSTQNLPDQAALSFLFLEKTKK
jgi:uncharacterized protein YpuA (DUF1002 family)